MQNWGADGHRKHAAVNNLLIEKSLGLLAAKPGSLCGIEIAPADSPGVVKTTVLLASASPVQAKAYSGLLS